MAAGVSLISCLPVFTLDGQSLKLNQEHLPDADALQQLHPPPFQQTLTFVVFSQISLKMFYTCGPNEAMVVSGEMCTHSKSACWIVSVTCSISS